jgi:hypothetical protein
VIIEIQGIFVAYCSSKSCQVETTLLQLPYTQPPQSETHVEGISFRTAYSIAKYMAG